MIKWTNNLLNTSPFKQAKVRVLKIKNSIKHDYVIFLVTFLMLIASAVNYLLCSQLKICDKFILDQSFVNNICIKKEQQRSVLSVTDRSKISDLLIKINDIKVEKLSDMQEQEFFANEKRLLHKDYYSVEFNRDKQIAVKIMIWPDGSIAMPDTATLMSSKKTIMYKSETLHPEIYEFIRASTNF